MFLQRKRTAVKDNYNARLNSVESALLRWNGEHFMTVTLDVPPDKDATF